MIRSVLFVCLGNICRSPTAEGVFRHRAHAAGLTHLHIDSAGTANWHEGKAPDPRTVRAAARRGYDLSPLRARQVQVSDFEQFDLVLAMDRQNLRDLRSLVKAPRHDEQLQLMLDFVDGWRDKDVPDPYYGGAEGFEQVLDLIEAASDGLIRHLQSGRP